MNNITISESIKYIGVDDTTLDLFESQYIVPNGVSYNSYLILDDNLQTALINASKRGVDVRIITPGIPDKKIVFRVTRSYYQTLMKHGIRIYEYTPGFIHAKNFLVDDKCATVGTINLDYRSLYLHFENGIYIYKSKILKDIKEDFLKTEEVCHEVTLEEVITGKFMGWFEAILRVIAPLL